MSEQAAETTHTVTLRFTGPQAEEMADHFYASWVDGEISQAWAEALDEADIAEAVEYEGDEETRTLTIAATEADDEEEEEETAENDDADKDEEEAA